MDVQQSVAHLKDMIQKAGGLGHDLEGVWNKWAQDLMRERGWDEERQSYLKPLTSEWEKKACLVFGSNTFQLNHPTHDDTQIRIGQFGIQFEKCIFPGKVIFLPGTYEHVVNMEKVRFLEGAIFENCRFSKIAYFSSVRSYDGLNFSDTHFLDKADFSRLGIYNFTSGSSFTNAIFDKDVTFRNSAFESNVDFSGCRFSNITDFSLSRFVGEANFSAIISERSFILMNADFEVPPDFTSYRMDHLPYINGAHVERFADNDLWSKGYGLEGEISKFQALKALAIQAHDHEMETYFFAEEMRCKYLELKSLNVTFLERLTILLNMFPYFVYRVLSNYGLSIIRPTVSWFCLILSLTVIYSKFSIDKMCTALYLSILHSLPVFGLFKTDNQKLAAQALEHQNRWWDLIYISHNILASLLVFLLFQAIRNRFKIK